MTSLLLSLGPGAHETLCVTSKSGVSVSPSLMEILQSNPASLQIQILWGLLFPLPDPQAGKPFAGFRLMSPVGGLLWYNYFPVCDSSAPLLCGGANAPPTPEGLVPHALPPRP